MKRKESIMPNDDWYMYTVHSPAKPSDPGSPLSPLIPRKPRGPLAPLRPITPIVPFEPVSPFSNIAELAMNNIVSYMYEYNAFGKCSPLSPSVFCWLYYSVNNANVKNML